MITEIDLVIRLLLAIGLGALIGLEREIDDEPAGLRTHMLVCLGATLFTIISMYLGDIADPARIAAGVVTGIGFLAAGVIFRAQDRVKGLTTAADLWVLAAVGVAIGIGYYLAAVLTSLFVFIILFLKKVLKGKI